VVACPRRPPIQSPHTSRACVGGTHPGSVGTRDAANRSRHTGDARPAGPSPRMAVSCEPVRSILRSLFTRPPDIISRDYYSALLRTHQAFVAPTQGKLLNYVQRVPLGVVAQITVRRTHRMKYYIYRTDAFFIRPSRSTIRCSSLSRKLPRLWPQETASL
jgi:hypothetical protein